MFNDCRVYGSAMLFIMINIVYIGVKYVNYSANVSSIIASLRFLPYKMLYRSFYKLNVAGIHDQSSLFAFIRSRFIFSNCELVNWELIAIENVIDLTKLIIFDENNHHFSILFNFLSAKMTGIFRFF